MIDPSIYVIDPPYIDGSPIYVGEWNTGMTANKRFHEMLEGETNAVGDSTSEYRLVDRIQLPQWSSTCYVSVSVKTNAEQIGQNTCPHDRFIQLFRCFSEHLCTLLTATIRSP